MMKYGQSKLRHVHISWYFHTSISLNSCQLATCGFDFRFSQVTRPEAFVRRARSDRGGMEHMPP